MTAHLIFPPWFDLRLPDLPALWIIQEVAVVSNGVGVDGSKMSLNVYRLKDLPAPPPPISLPVSGFSSRPNSAYDPDPILLDAILQTAYCIGRHKESDNSDTLYEIKGRVG